MARIAQIVVAVAALGAALFYLQRPRGEAHRLERELGLGERPAQPLPGEPATEGGGINSEIGGRV